MFILKWFAIAMAATIVFSLVAKPCMGKGLMQIGSPFILRTWDTIRGTVRCYELLQYRVLS